MPYNKEVYRKWREKNRPYKIYVCEKCNGEFKPKSGTQKRCSSCRGNTCNQCGKIFISKQGRLKQKYCSKKCHVASQKGVWPEQLRLNPGKKPRTYKKRNKYGCVEDREWRTAVFERDGYTCQECGNIGRRLNAHHIKPYAEFKSLRWDISNGITLCVDCHKKTDTYGWQKYHKYKQARTGLTPAEQEAGQQTLFERDEI